MRVLTARRVAGCVAAVSVALFAAALALMFVDRHLVPAGLSGWDFSDVFGGVANLAVPAVGFVLASWRPANRVGWLFLAAGLALALGGVADAYGLHALVAAPGSLPAGRAVAWVSGWVWVIPLAALAFVFLLFPTGRLRSRRWRPAAWFVGGASAYAAVVLLVLAYAIVTGVLVGVYAGLVLLATQVFDIRSPIAVAGSTLAAAALFSPLRERVQRAVDRRFNRSRYDADQIVAAFAVHLKDAVDLDSVRDDLAGVVSRALEPAHVSVWVNQRD
jgi:hypothetical protein